MTAKIKLKTILGPIDDFNVPVTVMDLGGDEVEIVFRCKARTLTQWLPIRKEIVAATLEQVRKQAEEAREAALKAKEGGDAAESPDDIEKQWAAVFENLRKFDETNPVEMASIAISQQVEFAKRIATGWSIEDPMNDETLAQFEDRFPGGIQALIDKYDAAIKGARGKN